MACTFEFVSHFVFATVPRLCFVYCYFFITTGPARRVYKKDEIINGK